VVLVFCCAAAATTRGIVVVVVGISFFLFLGKKKALKRRLFSHVKCGNVEREDVFLYRSRCGRRRR